MAPKIDMTKGMSDSSRRFWAGVAALGAAWLVSGFAIPGWSGVAIVAAVFVGVLALLPRLPSEKERLDRILSGEKKREALLRQSIREARQKGRQFLLVSRKVRDPFLSNEMERIGTLVSDIMGQVEEDFSLLPRVRSLMDYHLDKGLEVASSYVRLSGEDGSSDIARERLAAAENVLLQMRRNVEAELKAIRERDFRELEISAESLSRILREDIALIAPSGNGAPSPSVAAPPERKKEQ